MNEVDFDFDLKAGLSRKIDEIDLDCRMLISENLDTLRKLIFKIEFDSRGNYFYIQIMGTSNQINYELIKFKRNIRKIKMYLYHFVYSYDPTLTTPYKIKFPTKIFHKLSVLFNHKNTDKNLNQFTSLLFLRYFPFHPKTVSRNKFYKLNPCDDLFYIFKNYSGYLCYIKGDGPFMSKGQNVNMFAWFNPYFIKFLSKTNAIELDATFKVLKPYKACIPQMIVNNIGVPMGIIDGPTENFYLYSLIFQSLLKIDPTKKLFKTFQKKNYVTYEHSCFNRFTKEYDLDIYK